MGELGGEGGMGRDRDASWLENRDSVLLDHSLNSWVFLCVAPQVMNAAYGL